MNSFGWGVVGPGKIAHRFAQAVQGLPGMHLQQVLGRDAQRAAAFAARWATDDRPAPALAPDLAALLADDAVQAVYIATPHAQHGALVAACLDAGKPVLCEKPLVPNLAQAQALITQAQQRGVFLMEALWSRFLPAWAQLRRWLDDGAIGAVQAVHSSFCFAMPFDARHRAFDPALAGGALLDIGIYNLAAIRWVLEPAPGQCPAPRQLSVQGQLAPTGVDQRVAGSLVFDRGVVGQFVCGFDTEAVNSLQVMGERGSISLPQRFWEATEAVLQRPGQAPQVVATPFDINGFEYEIAEVVRCVRAGLLQSPQMPHAETLALAGWLDECRRQMGVRYPFE